MGLYDDLGTSPAPSRDIGVPERTPTSTSVGPDGGRGDAPP